MSSLKNKGMLFGYGAILALTAVILAMTGNPKNMAICVACFIRDTAGAMHLHSANVVQYMRPEIVGFVGGSFLIAVLTKEFRASAGSAPMIRFVLGVMMMIGALAFLGCPLRMLIRMSAGDLNAYVGFLGFAAGVFTGSVALRRGFSLGRAYPSRKMGGAVLPAALTLLFVLSLVTGLFASSESGPGSMHSPVVIALGCGILFGVLAQRCRICFAGSLRDIFLMGNFDLFSIIVGFFAVMLVFHAATGGFHLSFTGQPIAHASHLWNFLGLYVVGFAATLAGGCPLRQCILAGQGNTDAGVTFLGMLIGSAFCHNFGLAASAASVTAAGEVNPGGVSVYGKAAVVGCIVLLFVIAFLKNTEND